MNMTCISCDHFTLHREGEMGGTCRRYPPVPLSVPISNPLTGQVQMSIQSAFPETLTTQTCGEYACIPVMHL